MNNKILNITVEANSSDTLEFSRSALCLLFSDDVFQSTSLCSHIILGTSSDGVGIFSGSVAGTSSENFGISSVLGVRTLSDTIVTFI